jgi:hypothetical protein
MRRRLIGLGCAVLLTGVFAVAEAAFNPAEAICKIYTSSDPEYYVFLCYLW